MAKNHKAKSAYDTLLYVNDLSVLIGMTFEREFVVNTCIGIEDFNVPETGEVIKVSVWRSTSKISGKERTVRRRASPLNVLRLPATERGFEDA